MLRLPDGMRDRIKRVADFNGRSMNAEIVTTLEEAYPAHMDNPDDFAGFYVEMMWHYSNAKTKEGKAAAFKKLKSAVERQFPGKTVKLGFLGIPDIIPLPTDD